MTFVLLYMASVDNVTSARVMLSRKKMKTKIITIISSRMVPSAVTFSLSFRRRVLTDGLIPELWSRV